MNRKKITIALLMATAVTTQTFAQLKVGAPAGAPNSGSILDASNTAAASTAYKGLYMPQVALTGTTTYGLNTAGAAVATDGMVVYNTATAGSGITAVTPGLYIWNNNAWNKVNTSATGNDVNIYAGDGTLAGPRTVTQAGNRLSFMGGAVGINTTSPVGLLANNAVNTLDPFGTGVNGLSLNWATDANGYSGSFYNNNLVSGANGLMVKVAGTLATTTALDVSQGGTQDSVGTSLFKVQADGNIGISTIAPTAKLDVNGTVRIRTLLPGSATDSVITTDAGGNLHKRTILDLINNSGVATNIYTGDGTLTGPRTVTMANNRLSFMGGNIGIGTPTPNAPLHFGNATNNRKIVLWETLNNDHQFYGLGVNSGTFRYQIDNTIADHAFFAAASATTSNELMRIKGTGNVGIGTATPTSKLDVNGAVRIRTVTQADDATIITPIYVDPSGNVVRSSASASFGSTSAASSASIASGASGTLATNSNGAGTYKVIVTVGDACGDLSVAEYYIIGNTGFSAINGLGGILASGAPTKSPTFNQISQTVIATTWTGKSGCAGGDNSTSLNYTLTVLYYAGTTVSLTVTNNGNITKTYNAILTRMN